MKTRTYYALTTQNAQMSEWSIRATGDDKEQVRTEATAEIERLHGPLVQSVGTNIFTDTELKNLVVVSETVAKRRYGLRRFIEEPWMYGDLDAEVE